MLRLEESETVGKKMLQCYRRVDKNGTLFKFLDLRLRREYPEAVNPVLDVQFLDSISLQLTNW